MPKHGIKIISETVGSGPELKKGNRVRVVCDIQLNKGDYLAQNQETSFVFGDRDLVAAGAALLAIDPTPDGGQRREAALVAGEVRQANYG